MRLMKGKRLPMKRRLMQKTDYNKRLSLLKSGLPRIVVRRNLSNVHIQIINYHPNGDKTVVEVISNSLKKFGWKGHAGNIPAAYLTGLVAGYNALKSEIREVVPDLGMQRSTKGSVIYAALKGVLDAGVKLNLGDVVPSEDRINGSHIAKYADAIKSDTSRYQKQFASYLKSGVDPTKLKEHFDIVKKNIENSMKK